MTTAAYILGTLSAVAATVLAFIFLLPENRRRKLTGFFGFVADLVNFKSFLIEKILKALYIFETVFCLVAGFFMLFSWYWTTGLILMLVGPIAVRLVFELFMLFITLVTNTSQINRKMGPLPQTEPERPVAPVVEPTVEPAPAPVEEPAPAPVEEPAPAPVEETKAEPNYRFCAYCGTKYDANQGGCPNGCGK